MDYHTIEDGLYEEFEQLKNQYLALKSKRHDLVAVKQPKVLQKDELMKRKLEMTLTKEETVELSYLDDEERINSIMHRGIEEARKKFESVKEFFESQAETMRNKSKRVYEMKKASLQHKEAVIHQERAALENKTTAEYNNERSIQKLLKEMNAVIRRIRMSREQILESKIFEPRTVPIPILPEPLEGQNEVVVKEVMQPKKRAIPPCDCGADCPQVPIVRGSKELTYKCWAVAEQDRRKALQDEEQTKQPPFTPFQGLPPPDAPRQEKKPVKTIPAGRILYAAPVEVT
jgi:hypothetical protein